MVEELSFEQQDVGHLGHNIKASRSGDYDWLHRPLSLRKSEAQRIWEKIKYYWEKSRKINASPRILEKLKSEGEAIGKHRVARIMRENGIHSALDYKTPLEYEAINLTSAA